MKLFKDNFKDYEAAMGLSTADVAELSDMSLEQIEGMEEGHTNLELVRLLCARLSLNYSTIYSDNGLQSISIEEQYDSYPTALKIATTKAFFHYWKDTLGKERWDSMMPLNYRLTGRFLNGSAAMDLKHLDQLKEGFKSEFSAEDITEQLATTMFSKISNYNLIVAKDVFGLQYRDISGYLKLNGSTVAGWGGTSCRPIPENHIDTLCTAFDVSELKFRTIPMRKKDFQGHRCFILSSHVDEDESNLPFDFVDPPEDKAEVASPQIESALVTGLTDGSVTIGMTDERVMKMYHALPDEAKQKVNQMIAEMFIDNM